MEATTSRRSFVAGAAAAGMSLAAALSASTNNAMADTTAGVNAVPEAWDIETDVVVMGYGFAGESSAISAAAEGCQVQVFEKAPQEHAGGNSVVCCGAIQLANGDGAVEYWKAIAWDGASEEECQAMADNVGRMPQWFNDNVFEVEISENTEAEKRAKSFNGVSYPESNVLSMKMTSNYEGGGGNNKWRDLNDVINDRYADLITVNYGAPVTHLIFDPVTKEVFGVRAEIDGVEKTVKANKGVIMACGGFENNYEMVQDFVQQHYEQFHIGSPYNTGDGILMLMEIGAKLRHMAAVEYGSPCQYDLSKQYHQAIAAYNAGDVTHMLHINNHGERFYPESERWPAHDKRYPIPCFIQETPTLETKNYPWWMVYDETRRGLGTLFAWSNPAAGHGWAGVMGGEDLYQWSDDNLAEVDMGIVLKADTIEELGQKMGFEGDDLATFVATVERYNENGANGEDPDFGRTPTKAEGGDEGVGMTLSDAPFYATRVCLSYLNTNGGGDRTPEMQVKDWKGNPIPRLYEAGEFGSLFYHYYAGGGNVCEAFTNGMVAGQSVAALESWA